MKVTEANPMPTNQRQIEIPPDPRVLVGLTMNPLTWLQAICELIDNSIDSFGSARLNGSPIEDPTIEILIPRKADVERTMGRFEVRDNGPGLSEQGLMNSLRAGYTDKDRYGSLGLFGMGFNVATGKIGQRTVITTARESDDFASRATLDLKDLVASGEFSIPCERIPKPQNLDHGTIVAVSNWWPRGHQNGTFPLKIASESQQAVLRGLGQIYATILRKKTSLGAVSIIADGDKVEGIEHCVWDEKRFLDRQGGPVPAKIDIDEVLLSERRCVHDGVIIDGGKEKCPKCGRAEIRTQKERVHGWVGIQRYDHTDHYGIDVIRNGRAILVLEKEAFFYFHDDVGTAIREYPVDDQTGRIVGEIHLDHVPVDFLKKNFEQSSPEWERAMKHLRGKALRPKSWEDGYKNESPVATLHAAYKRIRRFGRDDMYMGEWSKTQNKAIRISRETEREYLAKFHAKQPGFYDDSEWWKLVEDATVPPAPPQRDCPTCNTKNGLEVEECPGCSEILLGKVCIDSTCGKDIVRSAIVCPHCGKDQVNNTQDPWQCNYCSYSNFASDLSCGQCNEAQGSNGPTSLGSLEQSSTVDHELSRDAVVVRLASGIDSTSLSLEVFRAPGTLCPTYGGESVPLVSFKENAKVKVFVDHAHRVFTELEVRPVYLVVFEVAQFVYKSHQDLVGQGEHVVSNLAAGILARYWTDDLSVSADRVRARLTALFEDMAERLVECPEASDFFGDLPEKSRQAIAESIFKAGGGDRYKQLTESGEYLAWAPCELFVSFFEEYPDVWFNAVFSVDFPDPDQVGEDIYDRLKNDQIGEISRSLGDCAAFSNAGESLESQSRPRAYSAVELLESRLR